ncbi:TetR/AcrR family transcriptional regulator [Alcanivorax sp. JB21]|uniref:TetR/AcrR family transcriptional regulator n=1 Tax=Alcanivorax limicola TaxID=2874102 RepID=UPI001CC0C2D4|nr:TetR/AcrR family transcriptional regulator [Alcanivorax limicola]MBZ2188995.1 TetR/AcrR family transcriptional regulator [Alcanivorax limicola]
MARRNEHSKAQLRTLAIAAVRAIVAEHGPEKLSVRKVAERIGYTPGMLYHVFACLDELILHANAETLDGLLQRMQAASALPPAEALQAMAGQYLAMAREEPHLWQLVFMHRMPQAVAVPAWYQQRTGQLFRLVEEQMARLSAQRDAAAVHLAARTLWSSVHGISVLAVENKLTIAGDVDETAMLQSLIHHYLTSWARDRDQERVHGEDA